MELFGETELNQFLVYRGWSGQILAQLMRNTDEIHPSVTQDLEFAERLRESDSTVVRVFVLLVHGPRTPCPQQVARSYILNCGDFTCADCRNFSARRKISLFNFERCPATPTSSCVCSVRLPSVSKKNIQINFCPKHRVLKRRLDEPRNICCDLLLGHQRGKIFNFVNMISGLPAQRLCLVVLFVLN